MHEDLSSLESPFSLEEIRKTTFDLGTNKAHFCYGFPIFFFQKFLDVVKNDLTNLCEDLYLGKANLEWINRASIALIPKVENLDSPLEFRPISLINSSLKIVSKILATRLNRIINSLVDVTQSAFIKGCYILDNFATALELIISIQKCRLPDQVLKVDFSKAFDIVYWDFLLEMLIAVGLGWDE